MIVTRQLNGIISAYKIGRMPSLLVLILFCLVVGHLSNCCAVASTQEQEGRTAHPVEMVTYQAFNQFVSKVMTEKAALQHDLDLARDYTQLRASINHAIDQANILSEEVQQYSKQDDFSPNRLVGLKKQIRSQQVNLEQISLPVHKDIDRLMGLYVDWSALKEEIDTFKSYQDSKPLRELFLPELIELREVAEKAIDRIKNEIDVAKQVSNLARTGVVQLQGTSILVNKILKVGLLDQGGRTAPQLFSTEFWKQFDRYLLDDVFVASIAYIQLQNNAALQSGFQLLIIVMATLAIALLFRRAATKMSYVGHWHGIGKYPISVSLLVTLYYNVLFFSINNYSKPAWINLVVLILVLVTTRLAWMVIDEVRVRYFVTRFLMLLWIALLMYFAEIPSPIIRLYMLFFLLIVSFYSFYRAFLLFKVGSNRGTLLLLFSVALYTLILICMVGIGADELGTQLFMSTTTTCVHGLILLLFYQMNLAGIEAGLTFVPIKLLSENAVPISKHIRPLLLLFCIVMFLVFALARWFVFPSEYIAFKAITAFKISFLGIGISMNSILIGGCSIYCTFIISRAIQGVLKQVVLPGYNIDKGVQFSITRLVNYFICFVGFIVLLSMFGLELTKLTIFGSALGIGIGFGLQAVVNNFASGLILLFERPVKMGDMVQVGTDIGEVKNVGLRSTVIQTLDHAEIVVPNSDLITNQITNWTLTGKQFRLSLQIGVAYGTDIQKVLKILKTCADENPSVLSQPAPKPLFLAFGESSLDFELRVWLYDFNQKFDVLSELNQEIESEFAEEEVIIPFPQRDLHIQSIDMEMNKF